jgi:hypothetical protein
MIDYHKTETISCALFAESENGLFDQYEVTIDVTPDVAISRYIAFEVEKSKSKTIIFQTKNGRLPIQGQFLCVPRDIGRQMNDIFAFERKMYPRAMEIEVSYPNPLGEGFHIMAKFRDTVARTRISLAVENSTIIPLYDVKEATIPLKSRVLHWGAEFKDNILIVRLWNNKIIRAEEIQDDSGTLPKP